MGGIARYNCGDAVLVVGVRFVETGVDGLGFPVLAGDAIEIVQGDLLTGERAVVDVRELVVASNPGSDEVWLHCKRRVW